MDFHHVQNGGSHLDQSQNFEINSDTPYELTIEQLSLPLDILTAEFITVLTEKNSANFDLLVQIASGSMIADVVLTLQQPAADTNLAGLTVALDGPLILDMLDLSSQEALNFANDLMDLIKKAKVNIVTFKHVVKEMISSIFAPLKAYNTGKLAYGPLATRFQQNPNHATYARAVLDDINDFLNNLGITVVDDLNIAQCDEENGLYCPENVEDSLRNCLGPLHEAVDRRICDASSVASIIKMRKGHSSTSSITDSRYIFVTRNVQVARRTTDCLHSIGALGYDDVPPCVLDRQLAGVLWLCVGGSVDKLTSEKLLANCMDALYPRPALLATIRKFLANIDPKKVSIFEALMRDKRAQRCLLHKTVGYTHAVSQDHVGELLEEIRRSTAEEVEEEAQRREKVLREKHDLDLAVNTEALKLAQDNTEKLIRENNELEANRDEIVISTLERACKAAVLKRRLWTALILVIYVFLVAVAAYFSNNYVGVGALIPGVIVALLAFWFVPEKLFKGWLTSVCDAKFSDEIQKNKIGNYEKHFQIDRDSCTAKKREA